MKLVLALILLIQIATSSCRHIKSEALSEERSSERHQLTDLLSLLNEADGDEHKNVLTIVPYEKNHQRSKWNDLKNQHVVEIASLRRKKKKGKPLALILTASNISELKRKRFKKRRGNDKDQASNEDDKVSKGLEKSPVWKRKSVESVNEEDIKKDTDARNKHGKDKKLVKEFELFEYSTEAKNNEHENKYAKEIAGEENPRKNHDLAEENIERNQKLSDDKIHSNDLYGRPDKFDDNMTEEHNDKTHLINNESAKLVNKNDSIDVSVSIQDQSLENEPSRRHSQEIITSVKNYYKSKGARKGEHVITTESSETNENNDSSLSLSASDNSEDASYMKEDSNYSSLSKENTERTSLDISKRDDIESIENESMKELKKTSKGHTPFKRLKMSEESNESDKSIDNDTSSELTENDNLYAIQEHKSSAETDIISNNLKSLKTKPIPKSHEIHATSHEIFDSKEEELTSEKLDELSDVTNNLSTKINKSEKSDSDSLDSDEESHQSHEIDMSGQKSHVLYKSSDVSIESDEDESTEPHRDISKSVESNRRTQESIEFHPGHKKSNDLEKLGHFPIESVEASQTTDKGIYNSIQEIKDENSSDKLIYSHNSNDLLINSHNTDESLVLRHSPTDSAKDNPKPANFESIEIHKDEDKTDKSNGSPESKYLNENTAVHASIGSVEATVSSADSKEVIFNSTPQRNDENKPNNPSTSEKPENLHRDISAKDPNESIEAARKSSYSHEDIINSIEKLKDNKLDLSRSDKFEDVQRENTARTSNESLIPIHNSDNSQRDISNSIEKHEDRHSEQVRSHHSSEKLQRNSDETIKSDLPDFSNSIQKHRDGHSTDKSSRFSHEFKDIQREVNSSDEELAAPGHSFNNLVEIVDKSANSDIYSNHGTNELQEEGQESFKLDKPNNASMTIVESAHTPMERNVLNSVEKHEEEHTLDEAISHHRSLNLRGERDNSGELYTPGHSSKESVADIRTAESNKVNPDSITIAQSLHKVPHELPEVKSHRDNQFSRQLDGNTHQSNKNDTANHENPKINEGYHKTDHRREDSSSISRYHDESILGDGVKLDLGGDENSSIKLDKISHKSHELDIPRHIYKCNSHDKLKSDDEAVESQMHKSYNLSFMFNK